MRVFLQQTCADPLARRRDEFISIEPIPFHVVLTMIENGNPDAQNAGLADASEEVFVN